MADDVAAILEELEIETFENDIFEMGYTQLRRLFAFLNGNLHTSRLIRNLIWQDFNKLQRGELEPFYGNIRSYWYARVKPVLARARASKYAEKYDMMIGQFVGMVVDRRLFDYADFGFTDEGANNRALGRKNGHILLVAEKVGHFPLLQRIQRDYDVTIVALGGQPSALSSEYLLRELQEAGFAPDEAVPLLTIVDYDPAGDSIVRSFIWQMQAHGFQGEFVRIDLAHPDHMTEDQIRLNKFRLSRRKSERKKNQQWAARTRGLEPYGHGVLYGLEADAMPWAALTSSFEGSVEEHLEIDKEQVVRRRLKRELVDVMKELLLQRLLA